MNTTVSEKVVNTVLKSPLFEQTSITKRSHYMEQITQYTNPISDNYLSKQQIEIFMERLFGITHNLASNIFSRDAATKGHIFSNIYHPELIYHQLFSPNIVWLIFPQHNLRLFCSEKVVLDIGGINGIYKGQFREKPLRFKYYCKDTDKVWESPSIIILPSDSFTGAIQDLESYIFTTLSDDNLYQQLIKSNIY
tara:strand:+ start:1073 stop:1654 length:582 start_codon:yes stop_codon:yes gene_type:complete